MVSAILVTELFADALAFTNEAGDADVAVISSGCGYAGHGPRHPARTALIYVREPVLAWAAYIYWRMRGLRGGHPPARRSSWAEFYWWS